MRFFFTLSGKILCTNIPSSKEEDWKSSILFLPFQPCNAQRQHSQYPLSTMNKRFDKTTLLAELVGNYGHRMEN